MVARTKFVFEAVNNMLVRKALYGLKKSGALIQVLLAYNLYAMGYRPSYVDPDLWLRPAVKPGSFEYYEYTLCYVNDMLCVSHKPRKLMKKIQEYFKLKDYNIEPPDGYLGSTLANMKLNSGKYCWYMSPEQYVKVAVTNVEEDLARSVKRFTSKCSTPLLSNYEPWLEDPLYMMAYSMQRCQ